MWLLTAFVSRRLFLPTDGSTVLRACLKSPMMVPPSRNGEGDKGLGNSKTSPPTPLRHGEGSLTLDRLLGLTQEAAFFRTATVRERVWSRKPAPSWSRFGIMRKSCLLSFLHSSRQCKVLLQLRQFELSDYANAKDRLLIYFCFCFCQSKPKLIFFCTDFEPFLT